jgi:tRNA A37 threonylcarbamoyladenosine synthetase subunit TsaC/SUA5/YrdC
MISGFQTEMVRADVEQCGPTVIVRNGGTVAFSTEAVYGLGASRRAAKEPSDAVGTYAR